MSFLPLLMGHWRSNAYCSRVSGYPLLPHLGGSDLVQKVYSGLNDDNDGGDRHAGSSLSLIPPFWDHRSHIQAHKDQVGS